LSNVSLLYKESGAYDYSDSFEGIVNRPSVSPTEVGASLVTSSPKWVNSLFNLRNRIVKVFGLKSGDPSLTQEQIVAAFKAEKGQKLGFFEVYESNEHELILGETDKHLDFKVSIINTPVSENTSALNMTTVVKFNNVFGKLYFLPVKPFHKLIVPKMLKEIIIELENEND